MRTRAGSVTSYDGDLIAILDAGAQYTKVIDRRVRELSICSVILPLTTPASQLLADRRFKGVIISGGPNSLSSSPELSAALDRGLIGQIPILGICYGMQLLNVCGGGSVERKTTRQDGQFNIDLVPECPLWDGISSPSAVLLTHGDSVANLSADYNVVATASDPPNIVVAIAHQTFPIYGVQFHPEVNLSVDGTKIFSNFLVNVCGCKQTFTPLSRQLAAVNYINDTLGPTLPVLVLASGGVDSTVVCALLSKAIAPERIFALHVNTGFMRHEESEAVVKALSVLGLRLHAVDARERFARATTLINGVKTAALRDVTDPETKRVIIGDCFMAVCDDEIKRLGLDQNTCVLAQGSLRPDLIESGSASASAHVIKTHHNDTRIVRELRRLGRIIEPLQDYHKDEVRALGSDLGLAESLVWRQPFPGPGLAIRIICSRAPYLPVNADKIVAQLGAISERLPSGVSAHLLPVRTVGVQGDGRSYASLAAIVAVDQAPDWKLLIREARLIPKQVHCINRVVFVFPNDALPLPSPIIPMTVTTTYLREPEIAQARAADKIVTELLNAHNLMRVLSQVPVILFPASFGEDSMRSIAIRTFITNDFMTGVPAIPGVDFPVAVLEEMVARILSEVPGIARVCYDLTAKPPGTTEWE